MPTLCLFLPPPSPAHPGALYLASSRIGCASIRRSRAGQDPQAHYPPYSLPPPHFYLNCPAWVCSFASLLLLCICLSFVAAACQTPSLYHCLSVSLCLSASYLCLCLCLSFCLRSLSHHCLLGIQVKVPFDGWTKQYWAMIKQ